MTVTQPSPDWNLVALKWAGTYIDGSPADGWIELAYNSPGPMLDDDPSTPLSIFTKGIRVPITTTQVLIGGELKTVGYVSVAVPASNDPDIQGSGGTYTYTEVLNQGGGRREVSFVADKDAPGGVIWINRLPGVPPVEGEPVSAVYWSNFNDLVDRVDMLEAGGVGGGGGGPAVDDLDDVPDSSTRLAMTTAERSKLSAVAAGATANASNAQLRDRSTHTGSQPAATISDLQEAVEDFVGSMLVAGGSLTLSYDDATGKVTITGSGGDAETIRDTIGAALIGTSGVLVAVNDAADTITLSISGLTIGQVSGLQTALDSKVASSALTEAVEDAVGALLARSSHVGASWVYDDTANTLALTVTGGGGGGSTDPEVVRDTIGVAMRVGTGLQLVVDDAGDTITISVSGLAMSQVNGLTAALNDHTAAIAAKLTVVQHGADAAVARPAGAGTVLWVGSATPSNRAAGDLVAAPTSSGGSGGGGGGGSFVGAFDSVAASHRALSLRRVLSSYTGPLVRVRRASDNTEADIGYTTAGALDETALLAHVGSGDGFVTTWYDQSGNARHMTQATTTAQPRIALAGVVDKVNGKPAMVFDGSSDFLTSSTVGLYAAGAASMAAVMLGQSASNSTVVSEHSATTASPLYRMLRSATQAWNVQATSDANASLYASSASGDTTFNGAQHRLFYADTGSAISTWRDNAAVHAALSAPRGTLTPGRFSIGAHAPTTPANFFNGSLQELMLWGSDRTADRATIYDAQAFWTTV